MCATAPYSTGVRSRAARFFSKQYAVLAWRCKSMQWSIVVVDQRRVQTSPTRRHTRRPSCAMPHSGSSTWQSATITGAAPRSEGSTSVSSAAQLASGSASAGPRPSSAPRMHLASSIDEALANEILRAAVRKDLYATRRPRAVLFTVEGLRFGRLVLYGTRFKHCSSTKQS